MSPWLMYNNFGKDHNKSKCIIYDSIKCVKCELVRYHVAKSFLTNCFAQSVHNSKIVFLIDRMIFWQEFMMDHAIAIEEKSEQNLHI